MAHDPFNYHWVEDGKIIAGSLPLEPGNIEELKQVGIRVIISLTRRDYMSYPSFTDAKIDGLMRFHAPISDMGLPDKTTYRRLLTFMQMLQEPFYIHCRGGLGRTGIILIAHYIHNRGMTLDEARQIVARRKNIWGVAAGPSAGQQPEWVTALPEDKWYA